MARAFPANLPSWEPKIPKPSQVSLTLKASKLQRPKKTLLGYVEPLTKAPKPRRFLLKAGLDPQSREKFGPPNGSFKHVMLILQKRFLVKKFDSCFLSRKGQEVKSIKGRKYSRSILGQGLKPGQQKLGLF
jgi:hypothetical protein